MRRHKRFLIPARFILILTLLALLAACAPAQQGGMTASVPPALSPVPSVTPSIPPSPTARNLAPTATELPPTATPSVVVSPTMTPTMMPIPPTPDIGERVSGSVTIESPEKLPPDAILMIQLRLYQDIGYMTVKEQIISPIGTETIPFTLEVGNPDPYPGASFAVGAEIRAPGKVTWFAEAPVPTPHDPESVVEVRVQPPAADTLAGTIRYPADFTMPENATLILRLFDEEGFRGPDIVLNKLVLQPAESEPTRFVLEYPSNLTGAPRQLAFHAELRAEGRLLLASPLAAVSEESPPATVELELGKPLEVATIRGTASYTETASLPADATLIVRLHWYNPNVGDGGSTLLAEVVLPAIGSPIPYILEYDPATVMGGAMYVTGEIRSGEKQLFGFNNWAPIEKQPESLVDLPLTPY